MNMIRKNDEKCVNLMKRLSNGENEENLGHPKIWS